MAELGEVKLTQNAKNTAQNRANGKRLLLPCVPLEIERIMYINKSVSWSS